MTTTNDTDDSEGYGAELNQTEEPAELGDVVNFPNRQAEGDRRWIVLYEEDYQNVAIDVDDNIGVLVDIDQVGEILRLSAEVLADLSHKEAKPEEPIGDMIEALQEVLDDGE